MASVLLWPLPNVAKAMADESAAATTKSPERKEVMPFLDVTGHIMVIMGSIRAFAIAYAVVYYSSRSEYPVFGQASTLSMTWALPIVARNVLATWVICGFWDWFLYCSPLKEKLKPYKLNPVYPGTSQFVHDATYTTGATLIASLMEILYCYSVCQGWLTIDNSEPLDSWANLLWIMGTAHIRQPHFYSIHRVMHPWRLRGVPDFGKFLYRHVHSVHHKSHNPTAFSGTSMHPVEAALYYSSCVIPMLARRHPAIVLAWLVDMAIGAWLGHDGFQMPAGMGDDFHQLHHAHSDCNYGTAIDGIDSLMGTFVATEEYRQIRVPRKES